MLLRKITAVFQLHFCVLFRSREWVGTVSETAFKNDAVLVAGDCSDDIAVLEVRPPLYLSFAKR